MSVVLTKRRGRVVVITLNRPRVRNAVDRDLALGLEAAVDEFESDDGLRVGVLAAVGPVFCAGADLSAVAAGGLSDLYTERGGFAGFVRRARTKPVIAALAGDALAGGMEIAIASDLIVAAAEVRLGIPEVARSLLAVGGALAELPRMIGEKAALELAMTAQPWPATRLYDLGLISRIADDPFGEAIALAETICANAPLAVHAARKAILQGRDLPSAERWALAERELERLGDTLDYQEGLKSFIDKRPPVWAAR